jgi:hypothetical protein
MIPTSSEVSYQVMSPSLSSIVKLNGENYADWAFVMKLVLKSKGLWEFVGDDKRPEVFEIEMNEEFFKKKMKKL